MLNFVPEGFSPPERLESSSFIMRKLRARDVYLDYIAVISNADFIREMRGGTWPQPGMNIEENLIDLSWHQREFEFRSAFTFTLMNKIESECLGCVYFYPPGYLKVIPEGHDVDINFWTTKAAYEAGIHDEIKSSVKNWLKEAWPWKSPFWSN